MLARLNKSPLLTDLYQLNMLQAYLDHGRTETAVFELFFRKLPPQRGFLLAAGLEQALDFLADVVSPKRNSTGSRRSGRFSQDFVDYLASFRFRGEVHAMPEGTVFFADEPVLRVTAPLPEAQLVETRLINLMHFQTLIASKAARMVLAAPGKQLVDFGLRRAHGAEAGLLAAPRSLSRRLRRQRDPDRRTAFSGSRSSGPWPIPSFRPMATSATPFSTSPAPGRAI